MTEQQHTAGSLELYASSKIIGRECSTVNKDFLICKKLNGEEPSKCEQSGNLVVGCVDHVVDTLNRKFPVEFKNYQSCLDNNDFRYGKCRQEERALLDCWNSLNAKH